MIVDCFHITKAILYCYENKHFSIVKVHVQSFCRINKMGSHDKSIFLSLKLGELLTMIIYSLFMYISTIIKKET